MDSETKRYVDSKVEAVTAKNDARFAEVRSAINDVLAQISIISDKVDAKSDKVDAQISILSDKVDAKASPLSVVSVGAAGVVTVVGVILGVLAFGGDRFDGGVQVQGAVSSRTERAVSLAEENARQINEIIKLVNENTETEGSALEQD